MSRIHLFELQDQDWYPTLLGDAGTAYLSALERLGGVEAFLAPPIAEALDRSGRDHIVDLCSGAGGPAVAVAAALRSEGRAVQLTLSDLKPNQWALGSLEGGDLRVWPSSVDAAAVPPELRGLRTLFNAFHHFDDALALRVLRDAVRAKQPIAIIELTERSVASVLGAALIPLFVWLVMPTVRPVRWSWLLLTYVLPILPVTIAWDGLVSHLRTRSPEELEALVAELDAPGWTWTARKVTVKGPMGYTALVGVPPGEDLRTRRASGPSRRT